MYQFTTKSLLTSCRMLLTAAALNVNNTHSLFNCMDAQDPKHIHPETAHNQEDAFPCNILKPIDQRYKETKFILNYVFHTTNDFWQNNKQFIIKHEQLFQKLERHLEQKKSTKCILQLFYCLPRNQLFDLVSAQIIEYCVNINNGKHPFLPQSSSSTNTLLRNYISHQFFFQKNVNKAETDAQINKDIKKIYQLKMHEILPLNNKRNQTFPIYILNDAIFIDTNTHCTAMFVASLIYRRINGKFFLSEENIRKKIDTIITNISNKNIETKNNNTNSNQ